jgi:hypothetical protein
MTGKATYEVGKGKPPKEHQFKPGDVNNPRGKSSEARKMEIANAELAAQAKNRFLRALVAIQAEQSTEEVIASLTGADILRLIKDAEDRAFGTPVQAVNLESPNGTMTPTRILIEAAKPDDGSAA